MIRQVSSPIDKNSKKFVRQEALEADDISTSNGSDGISRRVKATSDNHEETIGDDFNLNKEINVKNDRSFERNWSTASQHTTESGSEDNFSLFPDSDLSRSSEASSDKESCTSSLSNSSLLDQY